MSAVMPRVMTRGVVFIHSTPTALCPHIAWALEGVLDTRVSLDWVPQPAEPGTMRTEFSWTGEAGTGAYIASAMRGWDGLRYEVVEEASRGSDGMRWTHTPSLGIHQSRLSANGDVVVNEDRLRSIVEQAAGDGVRLCAELDRTLGTDWDDELEVYRHAGEGAPPTWLHKVG
ncbi:DUF3145 domain-containing protein [Ornithinimicrobium tianjinense]|uniref:DUF3145 domain-containing protein n=1 Tax=Ornithinimicrobium tianjinense TaxID=1195761 RepID=A0A917BK71_9MICO|nr:DUF3145 domain-containing protein [Ornithinimicrobium tianjinense]GGF49031.1 hypothetical protein GCM10011366_16150 [Ornithinimicrobium tianjinense]